MAAEPPPPPDIEELTRVKTVPEEVALAPPLPLNPASPSFPEPPPPELQESIAAFRRDGYLHLRQVVTDEQLRAVQAAFAREKSGARERWEALRADPSALEQAQSSAGYSFVPHRFYDVPVSRSFRDWSRVVADAGR